MKRKTEHPGNKPEGNHWLLAIGAMLVALLLFLRMVLAVMGHGRHH
jgi:hypothetical protein